MKYISHLVGIARLLLIYDITVYADLESSWIRLILFGDMVTFFQYTAQHGTEQSPKKTPNKHN